jgi:hypothetical protein
MEGAAGIWAMHFFSSTYFDENVIFVLSKDQTFRIRFSFGNPEIVLNLSHTFTTSIQNRPYYFK